MSSTLTALHEKIAELPARPGAYLFKDVAGAILYVGKARSLRSRVRSYFLPSADLGPRKRLLVDQVRDLDFVVAASEREALALEFNLIQKHRPPFNVRYSDDKSYPYIRIDLREDYPAICVVRQHAVARDGARYFGPYSSSRAMWQTIRFLRRVFAVCHRSVVSGKRRSGCTWNPAKGPRTRPCLDYHIGRCLGPCVGAVSSEEYRRVIGQVCDFLEGKYGHVLGQLREEMSRAAGDTKYELAARIRDQIASLEETMSRQRVVAPTGGDADALGYALREDIGCLAVLQIREGRLVAQSNQLMEGVSGAEAAEIVNELTKLHYQKVPDAPREVLLPVEIDDAQPVSELLGERRSANVRVFAPKRGRKREPVRMAMENAEQHLRAMLERDSLTHRRAEEAVAELQDVLALPVPPRRIEAFDISNVSGAQAVGSMIVFRNGRPQSDEYRRFRIRLQHGQPNDYEMMREVLSRRLQAAVSGNVKFERLPDLIVVDGGKGQLGVTMEAMRELDLSIPAAGLAKEHEYVYRPGRAAPISPPAHSKALHLLQRVRDEAHRFALTYHRSLRARRARESVLDDVPGIGPARKQRLLRHFKTLGKLRAASVEEIADAARCPLRVAQAVAEQLRKTESD